MLKDGLERSIVVPLRGGLHELEIHPDSGRAFLTICNHQRIAHNKVVDPDMIVSSTSDGMTLMIEFQNLDNGIILGPQLNLSATVRMLVSNTFQQYGFNATTETPRFGNYRR